MATSTNEEISLKRYLEDQRTDPIQAQLNHIHLDIIASLDKNRITDKTKYAVQQVIRSGQYTGWEIPRQPVVGEVKEVVTQSNLPPAAWRIGDRAYQRFTFKELYHEKPLQERKLTFNTYQPGDPLAKGFLHKHDVSFKDQSALDEIRKKQLGEEIDALRKLEAAKPQQHGFVGTLTNLPVDNINRLANPLNVGTVPTNVGVSQLDYIGRKLQQNLNNPAGQGTEQYTALQALRYGLNLGKFESLQTRRANRGKGKGKAKSPLTVQTNLPSPEDQYNFALWTYSPEQYMRHGEAIQTTSLVFNDQFKDMETLRRYAREAWNYPVQAGKKLMLEAERTHRKGVFADVEPRKRRRKTVGDRPNVQVELPSLSEVNRRVSQRVKAQMAAEGRAALKQLPPVSQKGSNMYAKINKIYNLAPKTRMTAQIREDIKTDVLNEYADVITQTDRNKLEKANTRQKLASTIHGIAKRNSNKITRFTLTPPPI